MQPRILWITSRSSERPLHADAAPPGEAVGRIRSADYDAAVLEPPFHDATVERLLAEIRVADPGLPVLIRDARVSPNEAVRLARLGAWQFLDEGPAGLESLRTAVDVRVRSRSLQGSADDWERLLVGSSREIRQVAEIIRKIGARRSTVLITGETGTGKELAARALHLAGPRRRGPMVALNCSAVPSGLIEAELFGHVRGAFTGAQQQRIGRFEQAHGGTLLLDEVGELPMDIQAKLLRVLQEREIQRLGSSETLRVDVRLVAATNRDLPREIESGRFREDLYYRLNVIPLPMPPLRRRRDDIQLLAAHFVRKICAIEGLPEKSLAPEAVQRLAAHSWPGNVRQLENSVEMAVALSGDRMLLGAPDFPLPECVRHHPFPALPEVPLPDGGLDFERTLTAIERSILERALRRTGGNKQAAADMLNLKRTTLAAKVRTLEAACN